MVPLKAGVLVQLKNPEEKIGAIHVPDQAKKNSTIGMVINHGPWCSYIRKGDEVLVGEFSGS